MNQESSIIFDDINDYYYDDDVVFQFEDVNENRPEFEQYCRSLEEKEQDVDDIMMTGNNSFKSSSIPIASNSLSRLEIEAEERYSFEVEQARLREHEMYYRIARSQLRNTSRSSSKLILVEQQDSHLESVSNLTPTNPVECKKDQSIETHIPILTMDNGYTWKDNATNTSTFVPYDPNDSHKIPTGTVSIATSGCGDYTPSLTMGYSQSPFPSHQFALLGGPFAPTTSLHPLPLPLYPVLSSNDTTSSSSGNNILRNPVHCNNNTTTGNLIPMMLYTNELTNGCDQCYSITQRPPLVYVEKDEGIFQLDL
jgi:hypothetical protein